VRDEALRVARFGLAAEHGGEIPYRGGLDEGFNFQGTRVPSLSTTTPRRKTASTTHTASRRLLDEDDGPMLDLLKGFHSERIVVPRAATLRPDRERLAERFERFLTRSV
jgi:hypothetical protein